MKITIKKMEKIIIFCREQKVILDSDLAELYEVETRRLNEQVKRNINRFPEDFMFQLNKEEFDTLKSVGAHGGRRKAPYVFTEQGIAMLSSVLTSKKAIEVNIYIMRAFVSMREFSSNDKQLELKIIEMEKKYDKQFKIVFDTLREALIPSLKKNRSKIEVK